MRQIHKCDGCSKHIKKRQGYRLRIELFACEEVVLDQEDLQQDHHKAIQELCEQLKNADPKKLEEDIYVSYNLNLCKRCRDTFSERIKCKEFI